MNLHTPVRVTRRECVHVFLKWNHDAQILARGNIIKGRHILLVTIPFLMSGESMLISCAAWGQEHGAGAFTVSSPPRVASVGRSFYTSLGHLSSTWEVRRYSPHCVWLRDFKAPVHCRRTRRTCLTSWVASNGPWQQTQPVLLTRGARLEMEVALQRQQRWAHLLVGESQLRQV